jgi:hypothetical protein
MLLILNRKFRKARALASLATRRSGAQEMVEHFVYNTENRQVNPIESKERKEQKMLKCKNEATKLLKTKGSAWVRFQNEPILGAERTHFSARANPIPSLRPDALT